MGLQGISELIKCFLALSHQLRPRIRLREAPSMIELFIHYMAPLMFLGLIVFMVIGYPGGIQARRGRPVLRLHRDRARRRSRRTFSAI